MDYQISNRAKSLIQSEIRNMSNECDKRQGINLSQGICDLPLPPVLAQAAKAAIDSGQNHYTRHDGIAPLRKAVAGKLLHYNKFHADAQKEIVITSGATGAFYCACLALLSPGDEVILFEPFYGYHAYTLTTLDLKPVSVTLAPPTFSIDFSEIEKSISPRTKAIMICTPSNPCGKVFSLCELERLADLCQIYDLLVFTDEIYEYIVYDGAEHISPAAIEAMKDRVVTISGYSKTFSITGWRIGYCACAEPLAKAIGYASDAIYACPPAPLQHAVAVAIDTLPDSFYISLQKCFEKRRNMVCDALTVASLTPFIPQGAYYMLVDIRSVPGSTSKEKAMYILDKTGVAVVPGSAFYSGGGESLARLCFAKEDSILEEACERLATLRR